MRGGKGLRASGHDGSTVKANELNGPIMVSEESNASIAGHIPVPHLPIRAARYKEVFPWLYAHDGTSVFPKGPDGLALIIETVPDTNLAATAASDNQIFGHCDTAGGLVQAPKTILEITAIRQH